MILQLFVNWILSGWKTFMVVDLLKIKIVPLYLLPSPHEASFISLLLYKTRQHKPSTALLVLEGGSAAPAPMLTPCLQPPWVALVSDFNWLTRELSFPAATWDSSKVKCREKVLNSYKKSPQLNKTPKSLWIKQTRLSRSLSRGAKHSLILFLPEGVRRLEDFRLPEWQTRCRCDWAVLKETPRCVFTRTRPPSPLHQITWLLLHSTTPKFNCNACRRQCIFSLNEEAKANRCLKLIVSPGMI